MFKFKNFTYLIILTTFFTKAQILDKDLKDKNILVVYGGWEGHKPKLFAEKIASWLKEKKANEAKEIVEDFLKMIKDSPKMDTKIISEDEKTKLMSLSGVKQYPMRVKCATLAWHTLTSAMNNSKEETNTEILV